MSEFSVDAAIQKQGNIQGLCEPFTVGDVLVHGLYLDQYSECYFAILDANGCLQVVPVLGTDARRYARKCLSSTRGKAPRERDVDDAIAELEAECLSRGVTVDLHNRVAREGRNILVDAIHGLYRITADGWGRISEPIPKFRRFQGMLPLAVPKPGGNLRKLLELIKVGDPDDGLLLLVYIVSCFVADIPHPIVVAYGPQGSAKSTLLAWLISIIDPAVNDDVPFWNEAEFMVVAHQRWAVMLDNVTRISERFSDMLCKLVTGAAIAKRRLYTDEDLYLRQFLRVILMNGVNLPVDKPDLMDRCFLLPLERISSEQRKDLATLRENFEEIRGELLGGCFDALSKAIAIYPSIQLTHQFRLADFAKWGCAIAESLGYERGDFIRAYQKNVDRQNEEALDASPIAALITQYFKEKRGYVSTLAGTPTYVLRELRGVKDAAGIDERFIPRTPRIFGRKLQEARANLESHGFLIERTRGKDRHIVIHAPGGPPTDLPPSSPSLASVRERMAAARASV